MKFVVYEYNEKASPQYVGCRFMTRYNPEENYDNIGKNLNIIAKDLNEEDAQALIKVKRTNNAHAFIKSMPKELMNDETEAFIRNLLLNAD
jgi:hypothetical protein